MLAGLLRYIDNVGMNAAGFPKQELWAQYYTVGRRGYCVSDGEPAIRPTALEATRIAGLNDQVTGIAWLNFSFFVGAGYYDDEAYSVGRGESFIATSRRGVREVSFKPVSDVLEKGRLPKYTASWLSKLIEGNHDAQPDRYEDLVTLL